MKAVLVPLYLPLPQQVAIKNWQFEHTELVLDFELPGIFKGIIKAEPYFSQKSIRLYKGTLEGSYLYESKLSPLWNFFEWDINDAEEIPELIAKIKQGKPLLEEAQYRKNPPSDIPPSFRDGYGPSVYRDILNAYKRLFGKPTQALVGT